MRPFGYDACLTECDVETSTVRRLTTAVDPWQKKSKMLGQTSGVRFPTPKEGKKLTSTYVCKEFSKYSPMKCFFIFPSVGHLKILVYSVPVENGHLTTHFHICKVICNRPRTFERVQQSQTIRVRACIDSGGVHFDDLLWTVNFIANKNSAVIKLETCIVNVLCPLQVKFCIARVLMVECILSVQLNHSFPYMCLFVLLT
jgi:hypothetical protein